MAYGSHTLGRTFSVSAMDGIEVKIGENFKPIDKVCLPLRYRPADPTGVLEEAQYDFNTETAFLNWLKNKKKNEAAKEVAAKEAARKAQMEAKSAAAVASTAASSASSQQGHPTSTVSSSATSTSTNNNSVSPVMPGLSQDILMPTQLHSSTGAVTTQSVPPPKINTQTSFDPRIFENSASDPFEMTELQTINDMDELRAVFPQPQESSSSEQSSGQGVARTQQLDNAQNHSAVTNNGMVNNASPSEPEYQNIQKQPDYQNIGPNSQRQEGRNAQQQGMDATSGHDYQNVQIKANASQVTFTSKPDRPSLPPRNQNQTGTNGKLNPNLLPNGLQDTPEGVARASTLNMTFSNRTILPPISPGASRENTITSITCSTGGSSQPATPELPATTDTNGPSPRSRSPPPGYYASESPSPVNVALPAYTPGSVELPPSYPESLSMFTELTTSPTLRSRTLSEEERSRPDPVYDAMSTDDKNFVMTIMSMGFPKSRTSLAVKRLGKDDRPVVELLCAMDSLCSEGFAEVRVEEALNLHDNDQVKAKDFLKLWKQFEELGFEGDDIKRELIVHGNNEEKVLDSLTAS